FCETSAESELIQKLDPPMLADRSHGSPPGGIGGIMPLSVESMQTAPMSSSGATSSVNQQVPATNGERPLVSVIVPTHNRPAMLTEAVRSILAQTYPEIEIIVVNDAGTDVEHVVASLNETRRISYVRHGTNRGLAAARNTALKIARGKYIAYLDDDDRFHPDHIETLVGVLEGNDYRVAYTDAWRVHYEKQENGYVATGRDLPYSCEFNANYLLISNMFPVLTVMHERACLDQCGLFDESLTSHEDWDLWIRLSRTFPFLHVKKTTAEFSWRTDGSTMTSGKKEDFPRTTRLIYEKYRLFSAAVPGLAKAQGARLAELSAQGNSGAFQCSIIIPVYNRAELTRQCLTALAAVTEGASYEVIFVDNGSTDETAALLDSLGGDVRVVRNTDNLGFAKACNQGAAIAKSRYLVFLNNDTVPVGGWLTPLLHEVETHAEVAVVGSKLLYADDTIQHAGVAFSRDWFTPYHLYKGFPRDSAAVSRRRELQCVTAACMLVRKDMFDAVQGFDEGYRNGFEDVDLCLKIRAQGGKIIYQPQSVLYHLESQTPGRKLHEEANSRRLVQRWGAHWWLPDDDLLRFEDGYAFHAFMENGALRYHVEALNDPLRTAQWQLVADVQSTTHRHNRDVIGSLLTRADEWPADTYVLLWGASVCRHAGFADLAPRFWERILMIEEHAAARIGLARYALEAGKLHDADLHLSHLFTRQPRHGEGWLLRGILAMQREAYVEAGRAFQH
ncbi:MAG: glycosyltransferase, partial [Nitrospiraceae bacterium]